MKTETYYKSPHAFLKLILAYVQDLPLFRQSTAYHDCVVMEITMAGFSQLLNREN